MKPKRPTPPQGNEPLAVWVRAALLPWIESLELIGIIGGQKKTSAYGGYSLIINPTGSSAEAHPFKIYATDESALKFKLTQGYVITTGEEFSPTNMTTEFTLTAGVKTRFYLNVTSNAATISTSTSVLTNSVNRLLIGWVSTVDPANLVFRQLIRDHVHIPCA